MAKIHNTAVMLVLFNEKVKDKAQAEEIQQHSSNIIIGLLCISPTYYNCASANYKNNNK